MSDFMDFVLYTSFAVFEVCMIAIIVQLCRMPTRISHD